MISGNFVFGMGDGELTNQHSAWEILYQMLWEILWEMLWNMLWEMLQEILWDRVEGKKKLFKKGSDLWKNGAK